MHANATAHVATSVSANSKQCVDNLDVATSGDLQTHVVSSGFQEVEKMSVYYEICHSFFFSLSRACRLCILAITIHDVLASLIDRACKLDSMVFTDTVLRFARFANTKHTHSPHSRHRHHHRNFAMHHQMSRFIPRSPVFATPTVKSASYITSCLVRSPQRQPASLGPPL